MIEDSARRKETFFFIREHLYSSDTNPGPESSLQKRGCSHNRGILILTRGMEACIYSHQKVKANIISHVKYDMSEY